MTTMSQVEQAQDYAPPLPYAGFSLRIVSAILDSVLMISLAALTAAAAGFYVLARTNWGDTDPSDEVYVTSATILCTFLILAPLYFVLLWYWRGQTLGQLAVRVAVTDRDGYHISFWQSLVRAIVWPVSVLPLGLGITTMFFDGEQRMLHDMLAGTVVVELP
ncbi:MAG: RDD family protein [Chloroflexi bacterium]|nr:RDD family protein [Chloroflexota bacterium]